MRSGSDGINSENPSSRARTRGRDPDGDGLVYTSNSNTLRSRAGARTREEFYGPAINWEVDAAVNEALEQLHGNAHYRRAWCFYCLRIGINTFLDQMYSVLSCYQKGELREPAKAFHSRIRQIKTQIDKANGGAI